MMSHQYIGFVFLGEKTAADGTNLTFKDYFHTRIQTHALQCVRMHTYIHIAF